MRSQANHWAAGFDPEINNVPVLKILRCRKAAASSGDRASRLGESAGCLSVARWKRVTR